MPSSNSSKSSKSSSSSSSKSSKKEEKEEKEEEKPAEEPTEEKPAEEPPAEESKEEAKEAEPEPAPQPDPEPEEPPPAEKAPPPAPPPAAEPSSSQGASDSSATRVRELESEVTRLRGQLEEAERAPGDLQRQLKKATNELERERENNNMKVMSMEQEIDSLKSRLREFTANPANQEDLERRLAAVEDREFNYEYQKANSEAEMARYKARASIMAKQEIATSHRVEQLEGELDAKRREITQLQTQLRGAQSRVKSMEQQVAEMKQTMSGAGLMMQKGVFPPPGTDTRQATPERNRRKAEKHKNVGSWVDHVSSQQGFTSPPGYSSSRRHNQPSHGAPEVPYGGDGYYGNNANPPSNYYPSNHRSPRTSPQRRHVSPPRHHHPPDPSQIPKVKYVPLSQRAQMSPSRRPTSPYEGGYRGQPSSGLQSHVYGGEPYHSSGQQYTSPYRGGGAYDGRSAWRRDTDPPIKGGFNKWSQSDRRGFLETLDSLSDRVPPYIPGEYEGYH
eukprot:TRINITY_DN21130_c0_g1_i1.p1 TRINITY_DN21130_c0_g1~~TRINITY_DN21130_c0_g1_i1.p1  ORF type:complete len:503 (-),score=51.96 TRINITY_DN21130_c0_g1_i1:123-1631(-)